MELNIHLAIVGRRGVALGSARSRAGLNEPQRRSGLHPRPLSGLALNGKLAAEQP